MIGIMKICIAPCNCNKEFFPFSREYYLEGDRVLPAIPDFPTEGLTTNIDLNEVVNDQMRTMGEAITEANRRIRDA